MLVQTHFKNKEKIPKDYTFDGKNVSPPFLIKDLPNGTKSLVLICEDPDAIRVCGFSWIHWVLFDIPVEGKELKIEEGKVPSKAKRGINSFKNLDYGGPSPPKGTGVHNYHFVFYALDDFLNLKEGATKEEIIKEMQGHILEKAEIVGTFWRD
ncbi:MAG: YbhB/YbcL family Raf kinase inhibitor-like protein [Candidatus Pacearchaeota archaeon]